MKQSLARYSKANMWVSGRVLAASVGLAATLAQIPVNAYAQSAASPNSAGNMDEIVVTANKLNSVKVLDTPASLQAISGDTLRTQGVAEIMDVAAQIPGLSIQDLGPGDKKYVIRGINSTGDSTIGVYYGEAVVSGSNADDGGGFQSDIRLYDLERVEVLRGPQGTLYGASSMSGTIRFIPKSPDLHTLGGYLTAEGSETQHASGNYNFNGALNLPLIDGTLALRLVGWKISNSGYIDQVRVGQGVTGIVPVLDSTGAQIGTTTATVKPIGAIKGVNDDQVGGGRATMRYQPTEQLNIEANFTSQTETSGGSSRYTPAGVTGFHNLPPSTATNIPPVQGCDLCNTDVTQSPWTDNIKVFGGTVTYDTGFGVVTGTSNQYNRRTDFTFDSTPVLLSFGVPTPAETFEPREREVNSSELRFASAFDSPVNFVAGVYREHSHQLLDVQVLATNGFGQAIGPFCSDQSCDAGAFQGTGSTFFGRSDERFTTSYATFGEGTWKITDRWTAVVGVRYYTESLEGVQIQTHPFGGFPNSPSLVDVPDTNVTFNKFTWKANLSYKFSDGLLGYATASTGFRSGGLNGLSQPFEKIPPAYAPDSLTNYELGAKGRFFDGLFDYQADMYFIKWSNMQVQETTADGAFPFQGNAGDAKIRGAEWELTVHPTQYLSSYLSGAYTDAYLSQGAIGGATGLQYLHNPTLGLTGDAVPYVPRFQVSTGVNYRRPLGSGWDGMVAADANYRGRVDAYFTSNHSFYLTLPSYVMVGLRAGVIQGPWSITAWAKNLTNKRAEISAINSSQDPDAVLTVRPRTIGVTLTRTF